MLYSLQISVPANTMVEAPLASELQLCAGVIKRVWVRWRFGSGKLCGCRLLRESRQLWPSDPTEWFISGPHEVVFDEWYELSDVPYILTVEAHNLDDTYLHRLWVAVSVQRPSLSSSAAALAREIMG